MSHSLDLARRYLGMTVSVVIDRPLGSTHPKHGFLYEVNYGYVPGTQAPDGEELDAYVLCVTEALTEFTGRCVAIVHRKDDDDDKLIVVPEGCDITDDEICAQTHFQEQWFKGAVVRA